MKITEKNISVDTKKIIFFQKRFKKDIKQWTNFETEKKWFRSILRLFRLYQLWPIIAFSEIIVLKSCDISASVLFCQENRLQATRDPTNKYFRSYARLKCLSLQMPIAFERFVLHFGFIRFRRKIKENISTRKKSNREWCTIVNLYRVSKYNWI